jgi:hypothetical protein
MFKLFFHRLVRGEADLPEFLATPMIPLNLGRRSVVVPLYSKRRIANNNNKINKVGKYPVVGFFGLVVVIVIAMTEGQKSDGERLKATQARE